MRSSLSPSSPAGIVSPDRRRGIFATAKALAFADARSSASCGDRVRRARPPRVADGHARHRVAVDARVARCAICRARRPRRRDDRRAVRGQRRKRSRPRTPWDDRAASGCRRCGGRRARHFRDREWLVGHDPRVGGPRLWRRAPRRGGKHRSGAARRHPIHGRAARRVGDRRFARAAARRRDARRERLVASCVRRRRDGLRSSWPRHIRGPVRSRRRTRARGSAEWRAGHRAHRDPWLRPDVRVRRHRAGRRPMDLHPLHGERLADRWSRRARGLSLLVGSGGGSDRAGRVRRPGRTGAPLRDQRFRRAHERRRLLALACAGRGSARPPVPRRGALRLCACPSFISRRGGLGVPRRRGPSAIRSRPG